MRVKMIAVDPYEKKVEAVEMDDTDGSARDYIGANTDVAILSQNPPLQAVIDDFGLTKKLPGFMFSTLPAPLCGKTLLFSFDENGGSTNCVLSISDIFALIRWISGEEAFQIAQKRSDENAARYEALGYEVIRDGLVNVVIPPAPK